MPSAAYQDIVQRLDSLDLFESMELVTEIRARMAKRPKRTLEEFLDSRRDVEPSSEDWLTPLRDEWQRDF